MASSCLRPTGWRGGPRDGCSAWLARKARVRLLRMSGATPSRMASGTLRTRTTSAPSRSTRWVCSCRRPWKLPEGRSCRPACASADTTLLSAACPDSRVRPGEPWSASDRELPSMGEPHIDRSPGSLALAVYISETAGRAGIDLGGIPAMGRACAARTARSVGHWPRGAVARQARPQFPFAPDLDRQYRTTALEIKEVLRPFSCARASWARFARSGWAACRRLRRGGWHLIAVSGPAKPAFLHGFSLWSGLGAPGWVLSNTR